MKLLYCKNCDEVFNLVVGREKTCACGKTKGKYLDETNAVYSGEFAEIIGFNNPSFYGGGNLQREMDKKYPNATKGIPFEAFYIPVGARSVKKLTDEPHQA